MSYGVKAKGEFTGTLCPDLKLAESSPFHQTSDSAEQLGRRHLQSGKRFTRRPKESASVNRSGVDAPWSEIRMLRVGLKG